MNHIHKKRLYWLLFALTVLFISAALILYALRSNINLFYTPTQLAQGQAPVDQVIRVGGLVAADSVQRQGLDVTFLLTDTIESIQVKYRGILPDLFREGQGVVVLGNYDAKEGIQASQLLARHDENYMPPEVSKAMREQFQQLMIPESVAS